LDAVSPQALWPTLTPEIQEALRSLSLSPGLLETWATGPAGASQPQATVWASLSDVQRRSATLLGIDPGTWDALVSVLGS
jgi:hypothetical protein